MIVINSQGEIEFPCEFMKLKTRTVSSKQDVKFFLKNKVGS